MITHNEEEVRQEFTTLWPAQSRAVGEVLIFVFDDLSRFSGQSLVVQGDHRCGKTTVALYLLAYLAELQRTEPHADPRQSVMMENVFSGPTRKEPHELRFALVVPDSETRRALREIVAQQPGLSEDLVLCPDDVARSVAPFDLLIVDDAHLLLSNENVRSEERRHELTEINTTLFGEETSSRHEFDWIRRQSAHRVIFLDEADAGQPDAISVEVLNTEIWNAKLADRYFTL